MATKLETKTIGEHTYLFGKLRARQSVKTLLRIMKIVGPALGAAYDSQGDKETILDGIEAFGGIEEIITALVTNFEIDEIDDIMMILFDQVLLQGKPQPLSKIFDDHFDDNKQNIIPVFTETLRVNFSNFFKGRLEEKLGDLSEFKGSNSTQATQT